MSRKLIQGLGAGLLPGPCLTPMPEPPHEIVRDPDPTTEEIIHPWNGDEVVRLFVERWGRAPSREALGQWRIHGLHLRRPRVYLHFPIAVWRGTLITTREAVERFMDRAEELHQWRAAKHGRSSTSPRP